MAKNRIVERGAPLDASMLPLRAVGQVALNGLFAPALRAAL